MVPSQNFGLSADALAKVAVVPFYPTPALERARSVRHRARTGQDAALVSSFVSEALAAQGVAVVAPSDVETAFTGHGTPVPRLDPETTAVRCAHDFGATAVVLGRVLRWREREGSAAGSTRPASVSFELTLYEAPTARKLWIGRFDETQQSITEAILRARQYPGGGTRWLSTAEFARWGADEAREIDRGRALARAAARRTRSPVGVKHAMPSSSRVSDSDSRSSPASRLC